MDRRLLIPVVAVTAWAQQTSPGAAEAEKALRARVEQFYQLQVDRKYRQAESLVAEDTKDWYYSSNKSEVLGFSIMGVDLSDGNTKAKVRVKVKSTMIMMGAGKLPIELPAVMTWKIENGAWAWYIDPEEARKTPFGKLREVTKTGELGKPDPDFPMTGAAPDVSALLDQVKADRSAVTLSASDPVQVVTVSNGLPGDVDIALGPERLTDISVELDKTHLAAGGKASVRIKRTGSSPVRGSVHLTVAPLNTVLDIQVRSN